MASRKPSFTFCIVTILILPWNSLALRNYVVVINVINCTAYNYAYIQSFLCTVGKISEYPVLNVDVQMKKEIQRPFYDFAVYWNKLNKEPTPLFKANRIDYCGYKRAQEFVPIFKTFKEMVLKGGTPTGGCPIAADYRLLLTNLTVNTEYLPSYLPKIGFFVKLAYYNGKELFFGIRASGRIMFKAKNKNNRNRRNF